MSAILTAGAPGTCDFGHGYSPETWLTSEWTDYLFRVIEVYSASGPEVQGAASLAERLQSDWQILALEPALARRFLESALPGEDFGAFVAVEFNDEADGVDHTLSWNTFVEEITNRNRYFPEISLNRDALLAAALSSQQTLREGTPLFRARQCAPHDVIPIENMGAPPPDLAKPGRANPVGIAYLYAALDDSTAVHEARIAIQECCTVATFVTSQDLQVLNLADVQPPNPFVGDSLRGRLSSASYLRELSRELSIPVRESDKEISYIPTQYFCELIKNSGLDGVMYASSLHAGGRNIVVFDQSLLQGDAGVRLATVNSVAATWAYS